MRAIIETVLRDYYGVDGGDLSERITKSSKLLPRDVKVAALHRMRLIANQLLHQAENQSSAELKRRFCRCF
jgi:hypothetical protein